MTPTDILCQLIAIPSVNPMGRNAASDLYWETRISDWLEGYFRLLGIPFERHEVAPGRANLIARYDSRSTAPTVLLDAHQDTVPVEGMSIEPFRPRIVDGKVTGRGACDVKGGMAAMLFALTRLVREKPPSAANVILSCSCDEESTMIGVRQLVQLWQGSRGASKLLVSPPDCAVIAEPTKLDAVVAHRGVVRFKVHARGRACHSSEPRQGKNAIYGMARAVSRLEAIADELSRLVKPHPLCGGATLSVGRIDGGTSVNIVPAHCEIEVDRRIAPVESPQAAFEQLACAMGELGDDIACDPPWVCSPALANDGNEWIADRLLGHAAELGSRGMKIGVPFCTHASTIAEAGVPSVVFGPGSIAQAHTADEFIEIEQLDQAAEIYFRFCCEGTKHGTV